MQNDVTHDSLFDGKLSIKQARKGYRFSIDAVILASSIQPKPRERIIDLGTGCGIIPMILIPPKRGDAQCGVTLRHR